MGFFNIMFSLIVSKQHWINNHKKRSRQDDSGTEKDVTVVVKRRKIKKTSAYNLFCPDFNKSGIKISS